MNNSNATYRRNDVQQSAVQQTVPTSLSVARSLSFIFVYIVLIRGAASLRESILTPGRIVCMSSMKSSCSTIEKLWNEPATNFVIALSISCLEDVCPVKLSSLNCLASGKLMLAPSSFFFTLRFSSSLNTCWCLFLKKKERNGLKSMNYVFF